MPRRLAREMAQRHKGFRRQHARQIRAHGADRRRDRHVVVVEDNDEPRIHRPGIVHRLIGHARAYRAIADDGDDVALLALEVACDRHAEPGRDRGRAVRRAERVVFAFRPLGEPRQPAALADRADAVAPAGKNLVRVSLMADIPDQPVMRRVENVVHRHRQLDDPEPGPEMATRDRHRVDQLGPQLVGHLAQIGFGQAPQIGRYGDPVEKRGPIRDLEARFLIQDWSPRHDRRFTTNRATCRKSSALSSNNSRWATAWFTSNSAWARARSMPRIETNVAFPAAASAPTGLPVSAEEPSTSSRSSAIWKASPRSWA